MASNVRHQSVPRVLRRGGEIEAAVVLLGVADEIPLVVKAAVVAVAELIEDDAAGTAYTASYPWKLSAKKRQTLAS